MSIISRIWRVKLIIGEDNPKMSLHMGKPPHKILKKTYSLDNGLLIKHIYQFFLEVVCTTVN